MIIPDSAKTDALKKVAAAVVWYQEPEDTLQDPIGLVLYTMEYGTLRQVRVVIEAVGMDGIKEALDNARPGILSKKKWTFWHAYIGTYPPPEMPRRRFGDIEGPDSFDWWPG